MNEGNRLLEITVRVIGDSLSDWPSIDVTECQPSLSLNSRRHAIFGSSALAYFETHECFAIAMYRFRAVANNRGFQG